MLPSHPSLRVLSPDQQGGNGAGSHPCEMAKVPDMAAIEESHAHDLVCDEATQNYEAGHWDIVAEHPDVGPDLRLALCR